LDPAQTLHQRLCMLLQPDTQQLVYKEHTILCKLRSVAAAGVLVMVFISWGMPDRHRRVMHCLTLRKPHATAEDACNAAFGEATKWIDYHVEFEL
jgi:hypothetical protein